MTVARWSGRGWVCDGGPRERPRLWSRLLERITPDPMLLKTVGDVSAPLGRSPIRQIFFFCFFPSHAYWAWK